MVAVILHKSLTHRLCSNTLDVALAKSKFCGTITAIIAKNDIENGSA